MQIASKRETNADRKLGSSQIYPRCDGKLAPANEMEMQVENHLPPIRAIVGQQAVAFFDVILVGKCLRHLHNFRNERQIFRRYRLQVADLFFGHDQDMHRGDRSNIFNRQNPLVLKDFFAGKFSLQ